jgi:hypothetical protein
MGEYRAQHPDDMPTLAAGSAFLILSIASSCISLVPSKPPRRLNLRPKYDGAVAPFALSAWAGIVIHVRTPNAEMLHV